MRSIALVTGSSRGIGAATALRLARDGFDVCINYVADEGAATRVAEAAAGYGARAITVQADVADPDQVKSLFAAVEQQLGTLSVLVNNAGILFQRTGLLGMDAQRINRVLAVNVTGTLLCCKEAVLRMSTARGGNGGAIVNLSSVASRLGSPGEFIDYAASKGAVDTLTIGLAKEVAAEGIRVNAVRPGLIYTDMHAASGEPGRVERLRSAIPMQRGGQPEEIAASVAWLVSADAAYVTGAIIDVSGGR